MARMWRRSPFVLLLAAWLAPLVSGSREYSERFYCELGSFPIVLLSRNETNGEFTVVDRLHPLTKNLTLGGFRRLETQDILVTQPKSNIRSNWIPGLLASTNGDEMVLNNDRYLIEEVGKNESMNASLYYARECGCFGGDYPTVYCPFTVDTCLRPKRKNDEQIPGCMNRTPGGSFGGCAFILLIGLYICALAYLMCSSMVSHVWGFLVSPCTTRWNNNAVDRILDGNTGEVQERMRRIFLERRQEVERMIQEEVGRPRANLHPTSLVLRTKVYSVDESDGDANNDEQCAICYAPLEDGDKIGRLPCSHDFHAACLKVWLQRKNSCPLCQARDIAEVQYDDVRGERSGHSAEREEDSDSDSDSSDSS
jgi:hypothetical protein